MVDLDVLDGLAFEDVTEAAGLATQRAGRRLETNGDTMSGGATVGDYDDDGDLDLYLTRTGRPNALLRNDGRGAFEDVTSVAGVGGVDPQRGYAGAMFVDLSGDGLLDLWITSATGAPPLLYVNQGDTTFAEEAEQRGLGEPVPEAGRLPSHTFSSAASDWDLDGDLDLVVADWYAIPTGAVVADAARAGEQIGNDQCEHARRVEAADHVVPDGSPEPRTRLLENDGTGSFRDVSDRLGIDPASVAGYSVTFADYDGDTWPDLFLAGDFCTSKLLRNDRGTGFIDVTRSVGVGGDENGMGQSVEDVDGDGNLDWLITGISFPAELGPCPAEAATIGCSGNRAYLSNGDGTFRDATDELGFRDGYWGWGVAAVDLTNRGRRDVVQVAGWTEPGLTAADYLQPAQVVHRRSAFSPSRIWRNTGADQPWPEVASQAGFTDRGNGKALIAFDADGDGLLDLLKVNTEHAPVLYRNTSRQAVQHHWLRLRFDDPGSPNQRAVGASVRIHGADGREQATEVRAGDGFQSSAGSELHIGLGAATSATVEVRWPGDDSVERFDLSELDRVTTLTRGQGR
ncbi:MAG: CRTAC1 family protein [Acidimicrobiales bacterium]|nr:CRTAC1 family protein [Acidimicrobiales bacterium]